MNKLGLGRGLGALIPQKAKKSLPKESPVLDDIDQKVVEIGTESIVEAKNNPRKNFKHGELEDLVNSIKVHGIIVPIVVAPKGDGQYEVIAGERRFRAAKILGLEYVPAVVRKVGDQEKLEIALIENIQRQDLNPMEKAYGYARLMQEFSLKQEDMAKRVGQSRAAVTNTLRLIKLPEDIQKAIVDGKITEGHAKVIAGFASEAEQMAFFASVVQSQLSVRETEAAARQLSKKSRARKTDPVLCGFQDRLQEELGTKVTFSGKPSKGKLTLDFYSEEELQGLVGRLTSSA